MKSTFYLLCAVLIISCASGHSDHSSHEEEFFNEEAPFDDLTLDIVKFGVGFIFDRAAEKFGVSTDDVVITNINSIQTEDLSDDKTNFICDVDATNNFDARVETTFTVEYNDVTGEMTMGKWRYHITYRIHNDEENEFEGFLDEEADNFGWESAVVESDFNTEDENVAVQVVEEPMEVETVDESEVMIHDDTDFEDVSSDEIQSNSVINDVLEFGAAFIFDRANDKFGVSNSNIDVTDVESVKRREEDDNKTLYRCEIDATNNDDATVEAKFFVEVDNETQEKTMKGWRYSIRFERNDEEGSINEESDFESAVDESQDDWSHSKH